MSTRFSSLFSGFALSLLIATPVLVQAAPEEGETERDIIMSCRDEQLPAYRGSVEAAIQDMRSSIVSQWKRQVDFRLRATRASRRAAVERVLTQSGRQLDAALDQFAKAQVNGMEADVNAALDNYLRFDDSAEDQNLERWSNREVSFQALNTVLTRLERTLRTYANTRDRATITRVWNDTRKQAQGAFSQSRGAARDAFIEEMDACVYAMPDDEASSEEDKEPASESKKTDDSASQKLYAELAMDGTGTVTGCGEHTFNFLGYVRMSQPGTFTYHWERSDGARSGDLTGTVGSSGAVNVPYTWTISRHMSGWVKLVITAPYQLEWTPRHIVGFEYVAGPNCTTNTSSEKPTFRVTSVNVDTVSDYAAVCSQKVMARARIYTQGVGRTVGYFLYHDGQRSPEIVADTDAAGYAYAQHQREFSPSAGNFTNGWVKYITTSPNAFESNRADFKIQCQNANQPTVETKADARLVVDGKAEVNTCGMYRYTFNGTITYGAAGTVKYYWLRSDGARSADQAVVFEGAGTKTVSQTWDLGSTYQGWVRLMIISPNETQAQADFNLIQTCSTNTAPSTEGQNTSAQNQSSLRAEVIVTSKEDVALCSSYLFQFKGVISAEPGTKVAYYWERSDGVRSPEQTLLLESGSYSVAESWNLGGSYAGWARLHVTYPNEVISNQANIKITESCK